MFELPVAPSRVRGLKHHRRCAVHQRGWCRTFTGAWIETSDGLRTMLSRVTVAPSRVRGLKLQSEYALLPIEESHLHDPTCGSTCCRTFTGAWIETPPPARNRSSAVVAPSRVRGLKQRLNMLHVEPTGRTFTGAWIETQDRCEGPHESPGSHLHGCVD